MSRKQDTEINAGSMADIAFLLLIFFLVTTTLEVDSGILRKIPPKEKVSEPIVIKDKNILEVYINAKNEILIDEQQINLDEITQLAIDFIDNGGGLDVNNKPCSWCKGQQIQTMSDHPTIAFINIKTDRNTSYETYISVLDKFNASYNHLRNKVAVAQYGKNYTTLMEAYEKSNFKDKVLENKIKNIREKYPVLLSDADIHN